MKVTEIEIPDVLIIEPKVFSDSRGFFTELYHADRYATNGVPTTFVQDNLSRSARNVLRGLHVRSLKSQRKLVTVLADAVADVVVDVRLGSPTFGRYVKVELNDENRRQLRTPCGFALGFLVLSECADFFYKCDNVYSPTDELVLKWADPALGIDWGISSQQVSQHDRDGRYLTELMAALSKFDGAVVA